MTTVRERTAIGPDLLPALCELLQDSVHGGASVGFLAPLSWATAVRYWDQVGDSLGAGLRLWIAEEEGGSLSGAVQLAPCLKENGRHRGEIQKLLVHSSRRRRGVATALMAAAETGGARLGLSLLVLDTLRGSAAEEVYRRLGWQRAGEIPDYAAAPDGALHPTVYYYKQCLDPGQTAP